MAYAFATYDPTARYDSTLPTVSIASIYKSRAVEYITRSGATNRKGYLDVFFNYLYDQGIWPHAYIVPCQAYANKGSGSVLYAAGGLRDYPGAKAARIGTFSSNPANNDTITFGIVAYTFKTTLTGAANEVLIGADLTASRNNLVAAVTAGTGAGTLYGTGTVANATVTATASSTNAVTAVAVAYGAAGNALAIAETSAAFAWASGATTLTGGVDAATDITLINAPVWSNTGLVWANLKYGTANIPGLRTSTNIYRFLRRTLGAALASNSPEGKSVALGSPGTSGGGEGKGWSIGGGTGTFSTETATMFLNVPPVGAPIVGTSLLTGASGSTDTVTWRTGSAGRANLWKGNTPITLDLTSGFTAGVTDISPAGTLFTTNDTIYFHASMANGLVTSSSDSPTWQFLLLIDASAVDITDAQRVEITRQIDLICSVEA